MQVIVNGDRQHVNQGLSLANALELWGYNNEVPFAVAVNNQVIPKQNLADYILVEGSVIEILMPMQGG